MPKTKKNKKSQPLSSKNINKMLKSKSIKFEKDITILFFEMQLMVKLFHWNTKHYATHKATDEFYDKLNDNMDRFIEILLGKLDDRIELKSKTTINLYCVNDNQFKDKLIDFKIFLHGINDKTMGLIMGEDLLNIRDEILADVDQLLYLLTLK
jgi:hypothetical protein